MCSSLNVEERTLHAEASLRAEVATQRLEIARLNEDLQCSRQESHQALRVKSEFLSTMSHELRTPLNAVLGMSRLLEDTPLNAEQKQYVNMIHDGGELLLRLLTDVLDWSKVESGRLGLEPQPMSILQTIESAIFMSYAAATIKGLDLFYSIDPLVPACLVLDATRIRQILLNLLSNAIKFTESGQVEVSVNLDAGNDAVDDSGRPQLEGVPTRHTTSEDKKQFCITVSVRDTGSGVPAEFVQDLFQPFQQVPGMSARHGGTGLGLAITRYLVEAMGGKMACQSQEGIGSTFSALHIHAGMPITAGPYLTCEQELLHGADPNLEYFRDVSVLIVSDRHGSATVWQRLLESCSAKVGIFRCLDDLITHQLDNNIPASSVQLLLLDGYDSLLSDDTSAGSSSSSSSSSTVASGGGRTLRIADLVIEQQIARVCQSLVVFVREPMSRRFKHDFSRAAPTTLQRLAAQPCSNIVPTTASATRVEAVLCPGAVEKLGGAERSPHIAEQGDLISLVDPDAPSDLLIAELLKPFKMMDFVRLVGEQLRRARHAIEAVGTLQHRSHDEQQHSDGVGKLQTVSQAPSALSSRPHAPSPSKSIIRLAERCPMRILAVDDNMINQKMMMHWLLKLGYHRDVDFKIVGSGEECLALLPSWNPDIILMDVSMSPMDGCECSRRIRIASTAATNADWSSSSSSSTRSSVLGLSSPWIIGLTADITAKPKCLQSGMNDFLTKPLDIGVLIDSLQRVGCAHPSSS